MDLRPLGDKALLVRGLAASKWKSAHRFADALRSSKPAWVEDIVPAFDTVAISYDPLAARDRPVDALGRWVLEVHERASPRAGTHKSRTIEIPVRYGGADGPDLAWVAEQVHLSPAEVVRLHTEATYHVLAVGFMPGFGYLGGLRQQLRLPRRDSVRSIVPAGSVAIGGRYTGVYPFASPGGWQLVGRTSKAMFDLSTGAALLVGDRVRFFPEKIER